MKTDAHAIYQSALDILTEAILQRDEAIWERHICLPHFMSTTDGRLVHETREDLITGLYDFTEALDRLGVTQIKRTCDTARQLTGDTIVGYHTTEMFAQDGKAFPPYPVRWVMHLHETGVWKVSKSDSALSETEWEAVPHSAIKRFDRHGREGNNLQQQVFQTVLDRMDCTYIIGDYIGWRKSISLPLVCETRSGDYTFRTETELAADFDSYQREFQIYGVTDIVRTVKSVELIDEDTMQGAFRVHVLSGTQNVVPPWDGAMTMKRIDSEWRTTRVLNALGHLHWTPRQRTTETGPDSPQ
ncbi:MAG: hypothetical protein V2I76_07925 [Roseobacter sp.]|jgi:hypothetical protein|nr:hypothetical protein [Roseobacter sp.]